MCTKGILLAPKPTPNLNNTMRQFSGSAMDCLSTQWRVGAWDRVINPQHDQIECHTVDKLHTTKLFHVTNPKPQI